MSGANNSLLASQANYEKWFNCCVCLSPKSKMVFGLCQHKVCVECLYDSEGHIRPALEFCPICHDGRFPAERPHVPVDNIALMNSVGITKCPNLGCKVESWPWELQDHLRKCQLKLPFIRLERIQPYRTESPGQRKRKQGAAWFRPRGQRLQRQPGVRV